MENHTLRHATSRTESRPIYAQARMGMAACLIVLINNFLLSHNFHLDPPSRTRYMRTLITTYFGAMLSELQSSAHPSRAPILVSNSQENGQGVTASPLASNNAHLRTARARPPASSGRVLPVSKTDSSGVYGRTWKNLRSCGREQSVTPFLASK